MDGSGNEYAKYRDKHAARAGSSRPPERQVAAARRDFQNMVLNRHAGVPEIAGNTAKRVPVAPPSRPASPPNHSRAGVKYARIDLIRPCPFNHNQQRRRCRPWRSRAGSYPKAKDPFWIC